MNGDGGSTSARKNVNERLMFQGSLMEHVKPQQNLQILSLIFDIAYTPVAIKISFIRTINVVYENT